MKKLYIDCFVLTKVNGMSYCLYSILNAIPMDDRDRVVLIVPKSKNKVIPDGYKCVFIKCDSFLIWENIIVPFILLFRKDFDCLLSPSNTSPFFYVGGRRHVILHDVMFMRDWPDQNLRQWLSHFYYRINLKFNCSRFEKVFTVSRFSKSEILKYFALSPENIKVIYEAVKSFPGEIEVPNLPKKFFLAQCLPDSRKSTMEIVEAFLLFEDNFGLVLFGDSGFWKRVQAVHSGHPRFKSVIFVGRVCDGEQRFLYKRAHAFLFCSKCEGFGLPALEAMTFSCPVIAARCSSLPEICGSAALYVSDPNYVSRNIFINEIIRAMEELAWGSTRNEMVRQGEQNLSRFSWDSTASILLESIFGRVKGEG